MPDFKDRMDYIRSLFAPETPALRGARASLSTENDRISIFPEEGKLLQLLIRLGGIRTIVEIGTLGGYSALWMADALPADGKIITIEKDPARAELARKNISGHPKINLIEGDATDILATLNGKYDMAFIDADKLNYLHYLDWAEKHIRKEGLIVGDNTLLFDAVWHDAPVERVRETTRQVMRDFNMRLADSSRYQSILLPTVEGMTIARKLFD